MFMQCVGSSRKQVRFSIKYIVITMADVEIIKTLVLRNGEFKYNVPASCLQTIEGVEFVKLAATGAAGKLITGKPHASIAGSKCYTDLLKMRQDAADAKNQGSNQLFEEDEDCEESQQKKKRKVNKARVPHETSVLTIMLEGKPVRVLSPSHPSEGLWVSLTKTEIGLVCTYLKNNYDDADAEKRAYNKGGDSYSMGSGRKATKNKDGTWSYIKSEE